MTTKLFHRFISHHTDITNMAILSLLVFAVTCSVYIKDANCLPHHRLRHELRRNQSADDDDVGLAVVEDFGAESVVSDQIQIVDLQRKPPSYMTFMYETLVSNSKSNYEHLRQYEYSTGGSAAHKINRNMPVLRAILLSQITHLKKLTKISYKLTKANLGEFNRANIVLTLKDEVNLADDGSSLEIFISLNNYQIKQTLTIREEAKFYSIDVTNILKKKKMELSEETEPAPSGPADSEREIDEQFQLFTIECTISQYMSTRKVQFHQIFDVDNEAPFILLRYQQIQFSTELVQSGGSDYSDSLTNEGNWIVHQVRRRRRSSEITPNANSIQVQLPLQCSCSNRTGSDSPPSTVSGTLPPTHFQSQIESSIPLTSELNKTYSNPAPAKPLLRISAVSATTAPSATTTTTTKAAPARHKQIKPPIMSSKSQSVKLSSRSGVSAASESRPQPYPSLVPPISTVCRRHKWLVKPSDISLESVAGPDWLDLGYCAGSCPFPLENDVFNFTMHSYFVDRHRLFKGSASPTNLPMSHCIPITYKPLMVMFKESDGGFVVFIFDDASVDSCGCR